MIELRKLLQGWLFSTIIFIVVSAVLCGGVVLYKLIQFETETKSLYRNLVKAQVEKSLQKLSEEIYLGLDTLTLRRAEIQSFLGESATVESWFEPISQRNKKGVSEPDVPPDLDSMEFQVSFGEMTLGHLMLKLTWMGSLNVRMGSDLLPLVGSLLALLVCIWVLFFFVVRKKAINPLLESMISMEKSIAIASTTQALAHDVRKPFSMLKMVLEAISDADSPTESQEIAKASLPEVNQAMASVEGMIQDVMQIGNNSKPNQEVAAPEAVIDAAINELFRVFPEADVGIEYNLNHVHCLFIDTIRVGRVFSNILVNAVQAMNTKGKLWINSHEENGFVEFRLGNAGSCIPKDSLPQLFDAFFTSGKKGGTGLGLAIAQKVVNEHGGTIRCESDQTEKYPSGYVEFILTLPVATDLSPKRNEPLPSHSRVIHEQLLKLKKKDSDSGNTDDLELERNIIKKLKALSGAVPPILIVDDEAVYRNSLAGLLRSFRGGESELAKIPIVFAKNAWEAIHMVNEHSPFLIIQDIDLGVGSKNGIDVIKDLRQKGYQGRICVHSNRFLFDDQKTAVDAGADSVLPKPMSRAHFFKLIASALPIEPGAITATPAVEKKESSKPRIAYIDDAITFTLSWKMKLRDKIDVETFSSTTNFFKRTQEDKDFLQRLDVIVTDYYFGADDPLNGKSFAAELRKLGFEKPIFLASNGDFNAEDFKPELNGVIGKEVPSVETIQTWIR